MTASKIVHRIADSDWFILLVSTPMVVFGAVLLSSLPIHPLFSLIIGLVACFIIYLFYIWIVLNAKNRLAGIAIYILFQVVVIAIALFSIAKLSG